MDFEKLKCDSCGIEWKRQKTRGRKPKVCPDCVLKSLDDQVEEEGLEDIPVSEEPPPSRTKYPANTKWACHSCGVRIKIGIGINDPPTHNCQKRLKRVYALERV